MPSHALRSSAAIAGVGCTSFGKLPDKSSYDLGIWAFKSALADCGLEAKGIDGLIVNRIPDYQRLGEMLGLNPRFATITPGAGRFSGNCIQQAAAVIAAGLANTVALIYGNNGSSAGDRYGGAPDIYGSGGARLWFPYGMTSPGAFHAMMFQRHMQLCGTKPEALASIATTFRRHASLNPAAVMRKPYSKDEYMASRFIAEPLRLLDYCLINDGGVALIVTSADRAKDFKNKPVYIRGFAQASQFADSTFPPEDFWRTPLEAVAEETHAMADVARADINALMIYDNFTPVVLFALEGLGYCAPGESGSWVADGKLDLNGDYPTNTSGGHLSESYMQRWALNVEAVRQLRGECAERQVKDARHIQYACCAPMVTSIIYSVEES